MAAANRIGNEGGAALLAPVAKLALLQKFLLRGTLARGVLLLIGRILHFL